MKRRVDELLFAAGQAVSRMAARRMVEDGVVRLADGTPVRKPGQKLEEGTVFLCAEQEHYVSRGARKLLGGLQAFHPLIAGKICLDLGSSTGGFTQVLLEQNAAKVYAVDVGTDQLHPVLRREARVVVMEQTNARELDRQRIPEAVEFLTGDLSFISLTKVLPAVAPLMAEHFQAILLIKPQFEVGKEGVASGGIVRDETLRKKAVRDIEQFCLEKLGWRHNGTVLSPITGGDGNVEYLGFFER